MDTSLQSVPEFDESNWVYLGANNRETVPGADRPFPELLTDALRGLGFMVIADATSECDGEHRWVEAIRGAEVCVIDVGAASPTSGAELALAYSSGRPLIALRVRDEQPPPGLAEIVSGYAAAREIVFADGADCVAQLGALIGDPQWQQLVRETSVSDDL